MTGNRPRMLICYLCGREYGSKSLHIHIPQCQKKWLLEEEKKPRNERRALPPQPNADKAIRNGSAQAFDNFNVEAFAAFEQTLHQCPYCQRRFEPKSFLRHQKGCTAARPAKPAGTGLIKFSLTNRLVPGAIAGSMHGKASGYRSAAKETQPLPLSLCRPPPTWKPKLRAAARPAWTGAGGSNALDDLEEWNPVPVVQPKPSAQEWCLQAETRRSSLKLAANRGQSSHMSHPYCLERQAWNHSRFSGSARNVLSNKGNAPERPGVGGVHDAAETGGDASDHLQEAFEHLWRTHQHSDDVLPRLARTYNNTTDQESWSSQAPDQITSTFKPAASRRHTASHSRMHNFNLSSANSHMNTQSPSLRSSQFRHAKVPH